MVVVMEPEAQAYCMQNLSLGCWAISAVSVIGSVLIVFI